MKKCITMFFLLMVMLFIAMLTEAEVKISENDVGNNIDAEQIFKKE